MALTRLCVLVIFVVNVCACSGLLSSQSRSHVVRDGETLTSIGERYAVSPASLQKANNIADPRKLRIGRSLTIPEVNKKQMATSNVRSSTVTRERDERSSISGRRISMAPVEHYIGDLTMPITQGRFSSRFGWRWKRFHEGIDLAAPAGTPIRAAHDGVVVLARSNWGRYGKVIVLKGDGLMTVYAHNSKNLVRKGQTVRARQVIGKVGATGNVTGPHLHFETRVRNDEGRFAAINPRLFYR